MTTVTVIGAALLRRLSRIAPNPAAAVGLSIGCSIMILAAAVAARFRCVCHEIHSVQPPLASHCFGLSDMASVHRHRPVVERFLRHPRECEFGGFVGHGHLIYRGQAAKPSRADGASVS